MAYFVLLTKPKTINDILNQKISEYFLQFFHVFALFSIKLAILSMYLNSFKMENQEL